MNWQGRRPTYERIHPYPPRLAGIAAVLTAISPLLGWATKAKHLCNLHSAYGQLLGQIESVISQIRRNGLDSESVGASKLVHGAYIRMSALDELEPNQKIIDREDKKVREAFPEDYTWKRF